MRSHASASTSACSCEVTDLRIGISAGGKAGLDRVDFVLEAERLRFSSLWASETYGFDCFTPLAF